jgi:hypothetical protein
MWPSASEAPPFVVIGNPGSRRVELFQAALGGLELPPARLVAYADLLGGRAHLATIVPPGAIVRIESPGKDFAVEQALLLLGADEPDDQGAGYERIERVAVERLTFDKGRIWPLRQWYLGLRAALRLIGLQLADCPPHRLMAQPCDILTMFDKRACHARLLAAGVPVPPSLGPVESYDELVAAMEQGRCPRVFVKPAHGSSASGVIAFQMSRGRHLATTTVELVHEQGQLRLYNSRRLREYRDPAEVAALIDMICRQRVHVERWQPKASIAGRVFDLRVMVIGGRARHVVVRTSRGPMTNLHLLNQRGVWADVLARMGDAAWAEARRSCELAMESFPNSLYAGIDLLIATDYRRHALLEVNAFGDLLPGALCDGVDTYTAEIVDAQESGVRSQESGVRSH